MQSVAQQSVAKLQPMATTDGNTLLKDMMAPLLWPKFASAQTVSTADQVTVKDGQEIRTKQTIGKVHSNQEDSKNEYHFELWYGKTILDPQQWLAGAN